MFANCYNLFTLLYFRNHKTISPLLYLGTGIEQPAYREQWHLHQESGGKVRKDMATGTDVKSAKKILKTLKTWQEFIQNIKTFFYIYGHRVIVQWVFWLPFTAFILLSVWQEWYQPD